MLQAQTLNEYEFELPFINDDELRAFIKLAFGVALPDKQICANHSTPFRAFADAYFARSPVSVWKASRGFGGKSFMLALLGLVEAVTLKADVNILGGSGEQSKRILEHMGGFWRYPNAPREELLGDVAREMRFASGNQIEALMASQASVRGPHPSRLRLDEIDEMDLTILDSAMGQPMSRGEILSQVVQSSTHQYADKTMTECLKRAADNGYPVYEWCYLETLQPHGWLTPFEVARKKILMTAATWENEVELQEPSPETRAIKTEAVSLLFNKSLGEFAGAPHEPIEIEPPQDGATYATGADWAKEKDWTIIITYRTDVTPKRLVAFLRVGREEWPVMIDYFNKRIARYPRRAAHDATGIGNVVKDYIPQSVDGVIMVGMARKDLLTEYIAAIERHELEAPFIRYMESEHRLASVADVFSSGERHHLPDTIAAGALAYHAMRNLDNTVSWGDSPTKDYRG